MKIPLEYLVASFLLLSVYGVRQLGSWLSSEAGGVSMHTHDMSVMFEAFAVEMIWAFISMYLLTVSIRILGLLYITKKDKLGWF
jgi:hypothetical protein